MILLIITFLCQDLQLVENFKRNDEILHYENYFDEKFAIPCKFPRLLNDEVYSDSLLLVKSDMLNLENKIKINGELADFLYDQKTINEWDRYVDYDLNPYPTIYIDYVQARKKDLDLYYLGKVKIDVDFDSYLIVTENVMGVYGQVRSVYLVNTNETILQSIIEVSSYLSEGDAELYFYSKKTKKNSFLFRDEVGIEEDDKVQYENNELVSKDVLFSEFLIDNDGYIQILKK